MDEAIDKLVGTTELSGLMYVGLYSYTFLQARQEHLACFFPGAHLTSICERPPAHVGSCVRHQGMSLVASVCLQRTRFVGKSGWRLLLP